MFVDEIELPGLTAFEDKEMKYKQVKDDEDEEEDDDDDGNGPLPEPLPASHSRSPSGSFAKINSSYHDRPTSQQARPSGSNRDGPPYDRYGRMPPADRSRGDPSYHPMLQSRFGRRPFDRPPFDRQSFDPSSSYGGGRGHPYGPPMQRPPFDRPNPYARDPYDFHARDNYYRQVPLPESRGGTEPAPAYKSSFSLPVVNYNHKPLGQDSKSLVAETDHRRRSTDDLHQADKLRTDELRRAEELRRGEELRHADELRRTEDRRRMEDLRRRDDLRRDDDMHMGGDLRRGEYLRQSEDLRRGDDMRQPMMPLLSSSSCMGVLKMAEDMKSASHMDKDSSLCIESIKGALVS